MLIAYLIIIMFPICLILEHCDNMHRKEMQDKEKEDIKK